MTKTEIKPGETFTHAFTFTDGDGNARDLTGAALTAGLVEELGAGETPVELDATAIDLATGQVLMTVSGAISGALKVGKVYHYDVKATVDAVVYVSDTCQLVVEHAVTP